MRILQKIVLTLIAGGIAYLLTNITDQPQIWQLTMSVFVGGIVLVVQYLIDAAEGSSRATAETRSSLDEASTLIRRMNEAATMLDETEKKLESDSVTRLVKAAGSLDRPDQLLLSFAQQQVDELTDLFEGLRSGRAAHEGENPDWLLGLTDTATDRIDATSLTSLDQIGKNKGFVDEGQFWEGELGQRYLLRQQAAIDRNVRIRRLFVLVDGEADQDELAKLLQPHQEIGVETRVLPLDRIPALRRSNLADFIIFDQRISYEFETSKVASDSSIPFTVVALIVRKHQVRNRIEAFEVLWAAGKELKLLAED